MSPKLFLQEEEQILKNIILLCVIIRFTDFAICDTIALEKVLSTKEDDLWLSDV